MSPHDSLHTGLPGVRPVRKEIQALRAIAVSLVVLYHVWPATLSGGYIGVDVFFVISGYLITGHIMKPLDAGTFSFSNFYARRIRRLLPASLTVLLVTLVCSFALAPKTLWVSFGRQIAASAFYVENWVLAANSVQYSAPAADVSPVQHFWSLSAEEQFYLVWPLLLFVVWFIGKKRGWVRRHFLVALVTLTVASLIYSVVHTQSDPSSSYFITPTRAWEFGLGGVLSTISIANRFPAPVRSAMSWLGLVAIGASAFLFSAETPFPGSVAMVPVLGTIFVIAAGMPTSRWSPAWIFRRTPVQSLGDISYSLYLWHWPVIVFIPLALGHSLNSLNVTIKVAIIVGSILLAYISRRFLEKPFLGIEPKLVPSAKAKRPLIYVAAFAGMLLVALPSSALSATAASDMNAATESLRLKLASDPTCFGAAAMIQGADCAGSGGAGIYPDPIIAGADDFAQHAGGVGCQVEGDQSLKACTFGKPSSTIRIALIGDSHAAQYQPALFALAKLNGWQLTTYVRSSCPLNDAAESNDSDEARACSRWRAQVGADLIDNRYDAVFVSALSTTTYGGSVEASSDVAAAGFAKAWAPIVASGSALFAIRDNPLPSAVGIDNMPTCVETHADPRACAISRAKGLTADPQESAVALTPGAHLIDLSGSYCQNMICPAVIGSVLVYRDQNHITATFSRTLATAIAAQVMLDDSDLLK